MNEVVEKLAEQACKIHGLMKKCDEALDLAKKYHDTARDEDKGVCEMSRGGVAWADPLMLAQLGRVYNAVFLMEDAKEKHCKISEEATREDNLLNNMVTVAIEQGKIAKGVAYATRYGVFAVIAEDALGYKTMLLKTPEMLKDGETVGGNPTPSAAEDPPLTF